jgi:hypothetical protein
MAENEEHGIDLAEAIGMLRDDVWRAHRAGDGGELRFPVASLTLELKVAATVSKDGKAGFRVPFVNAELGGGASWQSEAVQTVTVVFDPPVDRQGQPLKITSESAEPKD